MLKRLVQQKRSLFNTNLLQNAQLLKSSQLSNQKNSNFSTIKKRDISIFNYDNNSYTSEQINYINQVQNLKYSDLVTECKNLKLKPKDRTRQSLIYAIIESLPKIAEDAAASEISQQNSKTSSLLNRTQVEKEESKPIITNSSQESDSRQLQSASRENLNEEIKKTMKQILSKDEYNKFLNNFINGAGEYSRKVIEIDQQNQLRQIFNQNEVLQEYGDRIIQYIEPKATQSIHYIENYSFEQQQKIVEAMSPMSINKEISLLLNRSNYINECEKSYALKIKTSKHELSKYMYSQLLCIENEYCGLFKDEAKQFLKEISNSRIVNSSVLHITKTLSDPIQFWHYASLFKWGSPSSLISLWKTLTLSIDFYDIDNIQTLTRCLYMIRKYSRFYPQNNQNNQEEIQFYEKLTNVILQMISEKDNQVSYFNIANILGYLKQINIPFTTKTQKNLQSIAEVFIDIYRADLEQKTLEQTGNQNIQENYLVSPEVLDNSTPDYFVRALFALSYFPNPPQIIINDIFQKLVDSGLEFFEKGVTVKILSQLMLSNIPINDIVAEAIRKNKKVIYDLSIREIYVFIYSFKDSNQDMGKLYHHFYFQTGLFLDNVTLLNDFKQVVMVAKIHYYILTQKINEHKRVYLEKRTNQVLNLINKSCTDSVCRDYIADIIYIASLFIPYLNKPDFLFTKIIKNIQYLKVNSENRPLFTNFIMKTLEKLNPHYDFFINYGSLDLEYNDKFSTEMKVLLNLMIKKFIESKLLSFFLLTIQLCSAPKILKEVVQNDMERHELAKNLTLQIIKILGHENNKFVFSNLVMFSCFVDTNFESIQDETIIAKAQQVIFESFKKINKESNENDDLLWIYYHSSILNKIQGQKTQEPIKNLNEYFLKNVVKPICENQIGVVNQIIHEDGIVQYFNKNVNYSNLQNIIYLPSILKNLAIDITKQPSIQQYLLPKINKESKFWNGQFLVENLIILNKLKINCFDIFENVCENLFTTFIYYHDSYDFQLNNEIYPNKQKIIEILDSYSNQYIQQKNLNPNLEVTKNKNFVALNVLACFVLKDLSPETISSIFEMMGSNQQIYYKQFVRLMNNSQFNLSNDQILHFYMKLPNWIRNKDLSTRVDLKLKQSILNIQESEREYCVKFYTKEMIFNDQATDIFINNLSANPTIEYFQILLNYLSIGEIIQNESQLEIIEKYYNKYYDQLSNDSHINMIQVIVNYQIMNQKPLVLPKNITLNEPAFYKFVNRVVIDGKEYLIPYQESFTLSHELQVPQFKIFPCSSINSEQEQNEQSQEKLPESQSTQKQQHLENIEITQDIYEYLRQISMNSSYKCQGKSINRYYLYHLIAKKKLNESTYAEEERLENEFKQAQREATFALNRSEDYSNFLVDFSLAIKSDEFESVDLNYQGEDTQKININYAIRFKNSSKKIGFIYDDEALCKVSSDGSQKEYHLSSQTRMKIELLEKHHGWTIYPIYYERWCQTFNTFEAKEKFIKKVLNVQELN
ncbi:hypothetical protein TTHERM_01109790 (macronuclear) [Tetrahymena thermophila SB210]|uniref:RAP domain protein n=1 Tax=Tetrahymena thermophila (strain SB210) TaxID=312017 RepID=Q22B76_TETTS|nr:hypothetical protein TTHERM_01109790 [Tetrahymena thermophila SB210]EAR82525.2 hypothetical protein TTHERM_01109790 [Tetrahymena thermophila SB210]|eukprot:XP_001030188.2 hypothetical protein TTHERM_01109790 [Tetrahymena thermophila SB210]